MLVDLTGLDTLDFDKARKVPLGNFASRVPFSATEQALVLAGLNASALLDRRAKMALDVLGVGLGRTQLSVRPCTRFAVGLGGAAPGPAPGPRPGPTPISGSAVMSSIGGGILPKPRIIPNPAGDITLALGIDVDVAGGVGAGVGLGVYGGKMPREIGTYMAGSGGLFLMCAVNGAVQMTLMFGPPSLLSGLSVALTVGIEIGTYVGFSAGPSGAVIFAATWPPTVIGVTFAFNMTAGISLPASISLTAGYTHTDPFPKISLLWEVESHL